jgi:hypothetical protein
MDNPACHADANTYEPTLRHAPVSCLLYYKTATALQQTRVAHTYVCMCMQVRSGLRHGGFIRAVEAWWGPVVGAGPMPDNYDGPLHAVKLIWSDKSESVVSMFAGQPSIYEAVIKQRKNQGSCGC